MDMKKIDKLDQCIGELDNEISRGLLKPLLAVKEADWETTMPGLKQECETAQKRISESQQLLELVRKKTLKAVNTAGHMSDLFNEMGSRIMPGTLSEHVGTIVEHFLEQGEDVITITDVLDQLSIRGVPLSMQNPPAVVASILARDERLEKIDKGQFGKVSRS